MKNLIKENLVLVIGLALPVLLIVLFFAATVIPKMYSTPPQYDMLFTVLKYDYAGYPDYIIDFSVKDNKLVGRVKKNDDKKMINHSYHLMVYNIKTESMREIEIDLSQTALMKADDVVLDETKNLKIDASHISPDGYIMENQRYSNNGLIGGLFGVGGGNTGYRLKKGSASYKINTLQNNYYYDQLHFIGWVIKK